MKKIYILKATHLYMVDYVIGMFDSLEAMRPVLISSVKELLKYGPNSLYACKNHKKLNAKKCSSLSCEECDWFHYPDNPWDEKDKMHDVYDLCEFWVEEWECNKIMNHFKDLKPDIDGYYSIDGPKEYLLHNREGAKTLEDLYGENIFGDLLCFSTEK